jgi:hypothetical protein
MQNLQIPPEYRSIEEHIRRAQIQRSMAVGKLFGEAADALIRGAARMMRAMARGITAARDARTVEADVLLNRIVIR